jgi:phosphate transport system substrate-binding protein
MKMKRFDLLSIVISSAIMACVSCSKKEQEVELEFTGIEDITFENYPNVDGSTSSSVLNTMVACKLLGLRYEWLAPGIMTDWTLQPEWTDLPEDYKSFFGERIKSSQTHGAFMNLIDGTADIILTHRKISPDEKAHADALGVTLIETPIALDAFAFVVNKNNRVKSLTVNQIQKIYMEEITNWQQVGGSNTSIKVFTRPRNSGSEEVFRTLVMGDLEPADFPEASIGGMAQVFKELQDNEDGICYTFNTYKNLQARVSDSDVPKISINGIFPNANTVKNGTYPFVSKVHVAIRSDLNRNSMAYKLYEWLQSEDAKSIITDCGFVLKQ